MPLKDHVDYDPSEHESRLLCNDPQACAWAWIQAYAKNLSKPDDDDGYYGGSISADELIESGMRNAQGEWDYISKGPLLDGVNTDPVFWDKLAALKGIEIPQNNRNSFFSCSC